MQQRTKVEKRHSRKAEKRRREAEHEARAGGVGAARPAPPHRPLPAGHPLHGLDVMTQVAKELARAGHDKAESRVRAALGEASVK